MIAARSLTRTFDRAIALRDVSLTIETGEMFALIGPDGSVTGSCPVFHRSSRARTA